MSLSFRPGLHAVRHVLGAPAPDLEAAAVERWEIAPAVTRRVAPARFLPGQLDRIRGTEFGSLAEVVRDFRGGFDTLHEETLGFRLRDVDLVDGVLYAAGALRHLRPRHHRVPAYRSPPEVTHGALYESWVGNRWFGNWLSDDCLTYPLAERFGAVTTAVAPQGHVPRYESLLGMRPRRLERAHFDELILFRDRSDNADRRARACRLRTLVCAAAPFAPHAGVFLLRGGTGMQRILVNEAALAERLAAERGFAILDPSTAPVEEIVRACAGARVVAGVEGSHLVHGLMVMPPGACLLVIQPADRVVSVLKRIADRQDQTYAFVVGDCGQERFSADWGEVARTLDLAQEAAR